MTRSTRSEAVSPPVPIELDAAYLAAVERIEALPENRSGADKTWVHALLRSFEAHYARARRIR